MAANEQLLNDWYKQQLQSYGGLTNASGGVSNTGVGDQMMSQYYQLQNNLDNQDFGELLNYASQNVGSDISGALQNQQIKRQQQAALDQWAKNQQGSASNLTSLNGGVSNTGIGDQIGSEYARLQNSIGASNRDYASMLGAADQGVGRNILGGAQNIMARQQQQSALDQWAKSQQGSMAGLTNASGGVSNTAIGDKIGSTYAQLQNAISNPQRNVDFNNQLQQSAQGIKSQIDPATVKAQQQMDAFRDSIKDTPRPQGYTNGADRNANYDNQLLGLAGMFLAPGLGSMIGGGLGLGSVGSALAGGAASGGIGAALTGNNIGKGMLGGAIGSGIGVGTNYLGNAMGLGNGLGGQLAKGAIGGGLTSAVRGTSVGEGALGGAIGSGVNYGVNAAGKAMGLNNDLGGNMIKGALGGGVTNAIRGGNFGEGAIGGAVNSGVNYGVNAAGNAMGLGKDIGGQATRGALSGAVNAAIRGGDIGQSALQSGIMSGANSVSPILGNGLKYANMYNQAQQQRPQAQSQPTKEGFQQWLSQNKIRDPGTTEGRNAIMAQYKKSIG